MFAWSERRQQVPLGSVTHVNEVICGTHTLVELTEMGIDFGEGAT